MGNKPQVVKYPGKILERATRIKNFHPFLLTTNCVITDSNYLSFTGSIPAKNILAFNDTIPFLVFVT